MPGILFCHWGIDIGEFPNEEQVRYMELHSHRRVAEVRYEPIGVDKRRKRATGAFMSLVMQKVHMRTVYRIEYKDFILWGSC